MTIKSSVFSPVYNTNPISNNLLVEMVQNTSQPNTSLITTTNVKATTSNTTFINANTISVILLAANPNRVFAVFKNKSTSVAYLTMGPISSINSPFEIEPNGFMFYDNYNGEISCIWNVANGRMTIAEGIK